MKPNKELTSDQMWSMYTHVRAEVRAEINRNKVNIDRSVFSKTDQEKMVLKTAKSKHKRFIKSHNKYIKSDAPYVLTEDKVDKMV